MSEIADQTEVKKLTRKDFVSDQDVRWCPGCGDYAILAFMQRVLPELGVPKENMVFVSGIGCSSRFPYYVNTYGLHTIHGRAPAIATGLKAANPNLQVWVVTGDGDGLSIGGNHLLHALRRNIDLKILLFNNRIYGLTKGQYSPTSELGKKTKSTPVGSIDYPVNPISFALSAEATFVARTVDSNTKHLSKTLKQAAAHKGAAFVEIFQNCIIFNDGAFKTATDRTTRDDNTLLLEDGKPLLFGKEKDKGIAIKNMTPYVVKAGESDDIMVHNQQNPSSAYGYMLSRLEHPEFPIPLGVFRSVERPTYESLLSDQVTESTPSLEEVASLIKGPNTWTVDEPAILPGSDVCEEEYDELTQQMSSLAKASLSSSKKGLLMETLSNLKPKPSVSASEDTSILEAVTKMNEINSGCIFVTDHQGDIIGILTERDILFNLKSQDDDKLDQIPIKKWMTRPVEILDDDQTVAQALNQMAVKRYRHIPILQPGQSPGLFSSRDILKYFDRKMNA